ncbi:tyrosine-protein phosphatase [Aquimarina agarilytica]|uniref:tyrosine-protein phosphatase n=1 Tax=Aquimarina agarilytica TaxID=1087449 RepID=UPI00028986E2|nr:CpsB/CapC family capsule biosynthesis tyrosine phosphatase [Aquimarina agarilytica]
MFSIFNKKIKISELFNDATDIHNHVLPGIDDGAKTIEDSLEMLEKFKALGFKSINATPHTMSDFYPNTKESIFEALTNVQGQLKNDSIRLKATSEYMLDPNFEEVLKNNPEKLLTFNDNHILVEMSFYRPYDRFEEVLYDLQLKGFQPILAHPERYLYYADKITYFTTLKNKGVRLQLNTLSLTNHYGTKTNEITKKLLADDLYDFIGTDAHKIEHLNKIETIKIASKYSNTISKLLQNNKALF